MVKKYVEQLKEKSDEVFKETTENMKDFISVVHHLAGGRVEASIDCISTGFNYWFNAFYEHNIPFSGSMAEALITIAHLQRLQYS
jgi:hypothetical protein